MRFAPHLIAALGFAFVLFGCGGATTPPRQLNLNRDNPEKAYQYFKEMARANQHAAEWDMFSPNFKRMLNQAVGRNVDLGDYTMARGTIATNSQSDMQLLLNSQFQGVRMVSDREAMVTISAGGRSIAPRMVKLTRWELQVRGDATPYSDFVRSAADAVRIAPDGSITVAIRPPQYTASIIRTFRPADIEAFRIEAQWYVDDFGGLDQLVGQSASGSNQPQPTPQPRAQPDPFDVPPAGSGSPDGPSQPITGFGSPDG